MSVSFLTILCGEFSEDRLWYYELLYRVVVMLQILEFRAAFAISVIVPSTTTEMCCLDCVLSNGLLDTVVSSLSQLRTILLRILIEAFALKSFLFMVGSSWSLSLKEAVVGF